MANAGGGLTFGSEHFGQMFDASRTEREMLATVETRLLLLAAMMQPPPELGSYVEQAVDAGIDWQEFERLAVAHRLLPFVTKSLGSLEQVPTPVRESLRATTRTWAMRSLQGAASARRATAALTEAGIASMVLKGPALAEMVYGNPAARMFVDIDLFVAPKDLPRAVEVMRKLGYEPSTWSDWTPERLAVAIRCFHAHDVELQGPGGSLRVELHWRAVGNSFYDGIESALVASFRLDNRCGARAPFATQVLIHGAVHGYRRLGWLRDAAALCDSLDEAEWHRVLQLADADSVPNAVLLGPYLAHRLFGVAVPEATAERIRERRVLLARLGDYSTMTAPNHGGIEEKGVLKMQLSLRDRRRDKIRYVIDKAVRLRRDQMNATTLRSGPSGVAARLVAQGPKSVSFVSARLGPKLKRSLPEQPKEAKIARG